VQGWSSGPWRAIPTAIFHQTATGVAHFCFALEPVATGAAARVAGVEPIEGGVRLKFSDHRRIDVMFGAEPVIQRFSAR